MICPHCSSNIPDDSEVCPACRADLSLTRTMPKLHGTFCASCGALVPDGDTRCPVCDMPVEAVAAEKSAPKVLVEEQPEDDTLTDAGATNQLPRIESSIPSEEAVREDAYGHERLPHSRAVLLAALASLLVVGGITLYITHPWDPDLFSTKAEYPADTSQAGFPGTKDKLSGQDTHADSTAAASTNQSDPIYDSILSYYEKLSTIAVAIDTNEATFKEKAISGELADRVSAKNEADALAIDVSNLISGVSGINTDSTPYADDVSHVSQMGNWLRNRIDALCQAWALSVSSEDTTADADSIQAPVNSAKGTGGVNSFKVLFDKNYANWKPVQGGSSATS